MGNKGVWTGRENTTSQSQFGSSSMTQLLAVDGPRRSRSLERRGKIYDRQHTTSTESSMEEDSEHGQSCGRTFEHIEAVAHYPPSTSWVHPCTHYQAASKDGGRHQLSITKTRAHRIGARGRPTNGDWPVLSGNRCSGARSQGASQRVPKLGSLLCEDRLSNAKR